MRNLIFSLFILAAAFWCYGEMRGYYFTDVDTFSLINSGRFHSLSDIKRVASSELMAGRMINAIYYRPLTSLILGAEYHFFGLQPQGYHWVDFAVFALTALVIFTTALSLWPQSGGAWIGLVAALFFVAHPVQVDNVPAIARLGDLLAGFFASLSWLFFLRFFLSPNRSWLMYGASLLAAGIGLFAKEPAVVGAAAIFFTVLCFSSQPNFKARLRELFALMTPFGLVTIFYAVIRTRVLGGLGGYVSKRGVFSDPTVLHLDFRFKTTLLGHIAGLLTPSLSDHFDRYFIYLFNHGLVLILLLVCAVSLLAIPAARWLPQIWKTAFSQSEPQSRNDARAISVLLGMLVTHGLLLFYTILMLRYLYLSTVPLSLLAGLLIVRLAQSLPFPGAFREKKNLLAITVILIFTPLIFTQSPLWNKDRLRRWRDGGQIAQNLLQGLESEAYRMPERRLFVLNIPYQIVYGSSSPVFLELPFNQVLLEHALDDYLELRALQTPKRARSEVVALNYLFLEGGKPLQIETRKLSAREIQVHATSGAIPSPFPWSKIPGRWDQEQWFTSSGGRVNFEPEPKAGWPRDMTLHLSDEAMKDPPPRFLAWSEKGWMEIN